MEKIYLEDCQVGDRVVSPGRTITETDLVMFAAFTGDWHPLHTDAEYAKGTMFGQRIAHGMLVLAISTGFIFRAGAHTMFPKSTIALSRIDKVRFVTPTAIGDTLHLESEVVKLTRADEARGLITLDHRVKNQRGEAVLTYTIKVLAGYRPQRGG